MLTKEERIATGLGNLTEDERWERALKAQEQTTAREIMGIAEKEILDFNEFNGDMVFLISEKLKERYGI